MDLSLNGMNLHIVETTKYKTNTIVLHIKSPLAKETVTKRALLPYILQSGTKSFPTRQEIRSYLDELYGATLQVDVGKKGENQIITFRMDVTNEKYLNKQTPLLEEALKLLAEILLKPITENGVFTEAIVANEKRNLKQRIHSIFDDKIRYANMRLLEEMCKEEPYGLSVWGYEEEIDAITPKLLFEQYNKLLKNDEIDLYIVGDVTPEKIEAVVKNSFSFPIERQPFQTEETKQIKKAQETVIIEEQEVKQGKLHIGLRTNTTYKDNDYYAIQLFNGLFGGFSHSKLFINVREKASLAYYASSRFESHKGLLMVMSGIEFENYEKAVAIIKEQLINMQKGDFSEKEIAQTKAVMKNQILETVDVPKGYVELLYQNAVAKHSRTIEDWLQGIDRVTKEDMIKVGQKITLDTIYFLKGKEGK